jgi:hypothetical protein
MKTKLGKIQAVRFGRGGYQDAQIGIHFTFGAKGWGCGDSRSFWDPTMIKCNSHCKWTETNRDDEYALIVRYVSDLLAQAKVSSVDELKGKPVEITFDGNILKSWRLLTEVI